jgi:arginyl-tRNA synthetase
VITDELKDLVRDALEAATSEGAIALVDAPSIEFERPRRREHGDWSTNVALAAAPKGTNPREVAQAIAERIDTSGVVASVDIAGPGFLNFRLAPTWLADVVRRAAAEGADFGKARSALGESVNVEFVSSNPTGPISVVTGRHAAVGDALANLFAATGHRVTREFYVNDAGRQIDLFAQSVAARYLQAFGHDAPLPEDGYHGEYLVDLAAEIKADDGDAYVDMSSEERVAALREMAVDRMLASMRRSLERFGTTYDTWFSERRMREAGGIEAALERLAAAGKTYEKDGAIWFRSSDLGDDKDRVLVRANGEPTYLAGDLAYLMDKFERGFDRLVYLWGADHHGTVARLLAAAEALGYDRTRVEVPLVQIVTLSRAGDAVKASKRAGLVVPLDELVDEVGADAARYTFLTRSIDSPLEFDIELVKQQAPENPVYYVQYAHARICSILRKADDEGHRFDPGTAPLELLEHGSEDELMRKLASYDEVLPEACALRAPQRIARYAEELAATFSAFYRDCRVITDDAGLTAARLALCVATKSAIASALSILGVAAPERM